MLLEMPNPIHASLIYSPAIFRDTDYPVRWKSTVLVLGREVIFTSDNNEWRYCPALGVNALDHCNPFLITRLYSFRFYMPI